MTDWTSRPSRRWLLVRGVLAVGLSVGVNLTVLVLGHRLATLPPPYHVAAPGPVVVPVAAGLAGTVAYGIAGRRPGRTNVVFRRLVGGGFVVSLVPVAVAGLLFDITVPGLSVLVAMHAAVAVAIVAAFTNP